jgi:hypothetical protein
MTFCSRQLRFPGTAAKPTPHKFVLPGAGPASQGRVDIDRLKYASQKETALSCIVISKFS